MALSIRNAYSATKKQRGDARQESRKEAHEYRDLQNKFKDLERDLCHADKKLQASDNDMDDERQEFREIIGDLDNQHLVDREEIRSLKQDISNTECDHDEYRRSLEYGCRKIRNLERENQQLLQGNKDLEQENQRLQALLAERDETITNLQAPTNDVFSEPVMALSSTYIYTQSNDETDMHHQTHESNTTTVTTPKHTTAAKDVDERDTRIQDLVQQNGSLISEKEKVHTDLESLRDEHRKCSGHLQTKLGEKDEELRITRAEKKTSDEVSPETVAALKSKLGKEKQKVEALEEANATLAVDREASVDAAQRLSTLSNELEVSRQAHAQCDENSASLTPRIGELMTAKEELGETLRAKNDEIRTLQEAHAACGQHANARATEITQLGNTNGLLQATKDNLSQQLATRDGEWADMIGEGRRLASENQSLKDLRTSSSGEIRSLQTQNNTLRQTVNDQQQHIHSLETNCPRCQHLREALDGAMEDVEMNDDQSRAELRREIANELRSQVPDDLRRRLRGEIERQVREEFNRNSSDLLARNTKRIQEQESLILKKDAELEKIKNSPAIDHTACERRAQNLQSTIVRVTQDTKILQGSCSQFNDSAKNDREELKRARTTNEDLKRELETVKAEQRRAQLLNPLQSKLKASQSEAEKMKSDRDKARNNCSIYSNMLSELKKEHEALQNEHLVLKNKSPLDGDSPMESGPSEQPIVPKPPPKTGHRPARQSARHPMGRHPMGTAALGAGAGKKRDRDESDGEADDEGADDRKKVKTTVAENVLRRLQ